MVLTAPMPEVTKDDLVTAMVEEEYLSTERSVAPAPATRERTGAGASRTGPRWSSTA
jgi:hypothetical protein